jgi:hypothetical protein
MLTAHRVRLFVAAGAWLALVALLANVAGSQVALCLGSPFNPDGIRACAEAPARLAEAIASPGVVIGGWLVIGIADVVYHRWW